MKKGKTINGIIWTIDNTVFEKSNDGKIEALSFLTEKEALNYFNRRRIIKRGAPRLHHKDIAVVYYSQTIISL